METILLLAILVIVVIILSRQAKGSTIADDKTRYIYSQLSDLKGQIDTLQALLKHPNNRDIEEDNKSKILNTVSETIEIKVEEQLELKDEEQPIFEDSNIIFTEDTAPEIEEQPLIAFNQEDYSQQIEPLLAEDNIPTKVVDANQHIPQKTWFEKFKENNPDLEKFIGENLINKIGILILVLGVSFFVKFAIDKDWINEPARVGIGMLCGGIVMGIAHRLRLKYAAFSSIFVAGAISIFYLTIGIAFHDYKLFNQTTAFLIMVIITIFNAFVSISYNRRELAVLSLIGGFGVPFMVSTGAGNYHVLLSYIAILNAGMLIIAYFKKWNIVTILAFIATCMLYAAWYISDVQKDNFSPQGALSYATIYYFIFSIAPILNNIRNKGAFSKAEYLILLSNTFFYFGMGANIFADWAPTYKGLFTLSLALYNLLFATVLYKRFGVHRNAIYFLLGLALTFITLTIPFQFDGNYITLFWACESVLLIWLSQKSKIATFKVSGIIVQGLMLLSLFIDWNQLYAHDNILYPFVNKIFLTGLVSLGALIMIYNLLKKEKEATVFYFITIDPRPYRKVTLIISICIAYITGFLEVTYQAYHTISNQSSAISCTVLYHYIFSSVLMYYLFKKKNTSNTIIAATIACFNTLLYLIYANSLSNNELYTNLVDNSTFKIAFINHYLILICFVYSIYSLFKHRKDTDIKDIFNTKLMLWLFVFCVVYVLSIEIMTHTLVFSTKSIHQTTGTNSQLLAPGDIDADKLSLFHQQKIQVTKIGYPILWGIISFILLIIGIRKQNKTLRIAALSLLGITIVKLFIYDIKNVSETGKIIAFILLGVLILIISFVYQKIKKLVIDNPEKAENEDNI